MRMFDVCPETYSITTVRERCNRQSVTVDDSFRKWLEQCTSSLQPKDYFINLFTKIYIQTVQQHINKATQPQKYQAWKAHANTLSQECSEFCKKQQEMNLNIPLKASSYKIFTHIYSQRKNPRRSFCFVENEAAFYTSC